MVSVLFADLFVIKILESPAAKKQIPKRALVVW